jgi:hypothetical protein
MYLPYLSSNLPNPGGNFGPHKRRWCWLAWISALAEFESFKPSMMTARS